MGEDKSKHPTILLANDVPYLGFGLKRVLNDGLMILKILDL